MFIDIWDKDNKAIKINEFSKDLRNIETYNNAINKLVADYGIVFDGDRIKINYYQIEFYTSNKEISYKYWFRETLYFLTLFDCFRFLLSDIFAYLYNSKQINYIEITAGITTMFKYDRR